MGNFALKGFKYVYSDEKGEKVLLDLADNLSNKGRIPFHSEFTDITVNILILNNMDEHDSFCEENEWLKDYISYYVLLDVILIREHIRSKYPKKVYEYGSEDDVFGKHAWSILKEMHPESEYLRPTRENSGDKADIVYINGTMKNEDYYSIVQEALNSLKEGGLLICFSINQEPLNKAILDISSNVERFSMHNKINVFTYRNGEE